MPEHAPAYANAQKVLPRALLREVQRHFEGGLLWVPARRRQRRKTRTDSERNRNIALDNRRGATIRSLAEKYGLSKERIRQILITT